MLDRVVKTVADIAMVEQRPMMEGRRMVMIIGPRVGVIRPTTPVGWHPAGAGGGGQPPAGASGAGGTAAAVRVAAGRRAARQDRCRAAGSAAPKTGRRAARRVSAAAKTG